MSPDFRFASGDKKMEVQPMRSGPLREATRPENVSGWAGTNARTRSRLLTLTEAVTLTPI